LLSQARACAAFIGSLARMAVTRGAVLAMWGRPFNCRSIRKALLSALYGLHVAEGDIDLAWTLADLGIDDIEPSLSAEEKRATIADLLTSRSSVYHPANFVLPAVRARLPARGSHAPGMFWHYNNWGFNALLTIFEQYTGTRFEEFERRIAQPLQMEDYRAQDMKYAAQPQALHPLYSFRLSTRDLARSICGRAAGASSRCSHRPGWRQAPQRRRSRVAERGLAIRGGSAWMAGCSVMCPCLVAPLPPIAWVGNSC
jgi:CubicO group peptidase (beta-lactamase class C family)